MALPFVPAKGEHARPVILLALVLIVLWEPRSQGLLIQPPPLRTQSARRIDARKERLAYILGDQRPTRATRPIPTGSGLRLLDRPAVGAPPIVDQLPAMSSQAAGVSCARVRNVIAVS
jgi:hypothetical protein